MLTDAVLLLFILCVLVGISNSEVVQPESFRSILKKLRRSSETLILPPRSNLQPSALKVFEAFAVPSSQGWSRCIECGLNVDGSIAIFDDNHTFSSTPILLSWSLWGEFFHMQRNDQYYAKRTYIMDFRNTHYIERPVFVLPMITLHVGHVLVDVVEQLYQTHMRLYGRIRKDCVIILDVSSDIERSILSEKIYNSVNFGEGTPGFLLRLFTDLPVFSIELWNELRQLDGVVFKDLHLGLDISESYFNAGQQSQPCLMSLQNGNAVNKARAERYQAFSQFLQNECRTYFNLNASEAPTNTSGRVFIEQREDDRKLLNMNELLQISSDMGLVTAFGSLNTIRFRDQLALFAAIDVLVSVAGTSLHNVLFMRPGSSVIMFMQPEWCEQAWIYANQALLLDIKPFVYCANSTPPVVPVDPAPVDHGRSTEDGWKDAAFTMNPDDPRVFRHYQWSRQFWLQGPRHHKSDDISVDENAFRSMLEHAFEYVKSYKARNSKNTAKAAQNPTFSSPSLMPLMCPGSAQLPKSHSISPTKYHISPQNAPHAQLSRLVEMYISSVSVTVAANQRSWDVVIVGEIGAARGDLAAIMRSLPHLSLCFEREGTAAWCYPVSGFNYYANLDLNVVLPLQNLHFWAQTSSTGGKIRHSDVFLVMDCRLPEAGFAVHTQAIDLTVHFIVDIWQHCVETVTNKAHAQVLRFPFHKLAPANESLQCQALQQATFQHQLVSRLSLQRFTADFCALHALTNVNCMRFISELQQHLRRVLKAAQLRLPEVQTMPTKSNPFFFMHVEKTAGSTLRAYIHESLREPNQTAFIPCHTTHCRVLALPEHSAQTNPNNNHRSFATNEFNWGELKDLRLVQPMTSDNSQLSVIAGHFDFYAAINHLPQCRNAAYTAGVAKTGDVPLWAAHVQPRVDSLDPVEPLTPVSAPSCRVSCFTVGRHPVDRAISYYYQRFYEHPSTSAERSNAAEDAPFGGRPLHMRQMNELTPSQLQDIAIGTRQALESHFFPGQSVIVDEGMSDATCRALLGLKYTTGQRVGPMQIPPVVPTSLYSRAVENVRQCVVGIQEQWNDTLRVLDHWFPWIDFASHPNQRKMSIYSGLETRHTLRPELYQVLVNANPCDMMVYEEMLRLFRAQLSVLDDPSI